MFHLGRKNIESLNDDALLKRYRSGKDQKIMGILFNRYAHLVYGVCLKYLKNRDESKDAVMEIFEKIIDTLKDQEIKNFKSWLYVVSRNHCLMELRKKPLTAPISDSLENNPEFIMESSSEMHPIDKDPENSQLKSCLETLSQEQRRCIELFYYQEKCYREISDVTRFDLKKVKSYIQNGKRNLKNCMEKFRGTGRAINLKKNNDKAG